MLKVEFAGCPTMFFDGVIVTNVLSSVATILNDENVPVELSKKYCDEIQKSFPKAFLPFRTNKSGFNPFALTS
jgi:hypothetical protein